MLGSLFPLLIFFRNTIHLLVRAESDIPFAVQIEADAGRSEANVKFFSNLLPTLFLTNPTSTIVRLIFNHLTNQNSAFCLGHDSIHLLDRTESDI